jgi:rhodanese-related sulfurtransferase
MINMQTPQTITVMQLSELYEQQGADLIDVRTPGEFREVHASFARNVPLGSLDPQAVMQARNGASEKPLYVICQRGNRSKKACQQFLDAGFTNVVNVDGGTQAWSEAGRPVNRGKKGMSLERQVRIAVGFLVFLGATLGFFVHPYFIGISAFVGVGLMFAGVTDFGGMGLLLAKMPWNRGPSCSGGQCST